MITPAGKNCKGFTEMLQFGDKAENLPVRCDKEGARGVLWVKAFHTGPGAYPPAGAVETYDRKGADLE